MQQQLPQELVNAIIDEIHLSTDSASSLKFCALVAHPFLHQSQKNLFSLVNLKEGSPASSLHFSRLLSLSPHIAAHVNDLSIQCRSENWESVACILSAVSNLTRLRLSPEEPPWYQRGTCIRAPFSARFSFPHLRILELCLYEFADAFHFQSLFSGSPKLESLTLDDIAFSAPTISTGTSAPNDTAAVVSKLSLRNMTGLNIDSILHSFTVFDIKHLHSLSVYDSPANNVLRPNAGSLRTLSISVYMNPRSTHTPLEPEILKEVGLRLQTLVLDVMYDTFLLDVLSTFGNFRDLKRLETVQVTFDIWSDHTIGDETAWRTFDEMLRGLLEEGNALKEVNFGLGHCDSSIPARLRSWMPSMDAGGVLRIRVPE